MSIFNKNKHGNFREIRRGEPEKKGVALYIELFTRKFWNYIKLNLLYVLTSIVSFLIYWYVLAGFVVPFIIQVIPQDYLQIMADATGSQTVDMFIGSITFYISAIGAVLLVTFFGGGVFSAGYNYILRNYVRQENAYIFSDYFGQTKNNFAQALVLSIIDKIVVSLCLFSMGAYISMYNASSAFFYIIAFAALLCALLCYAAMHMYMWTIMVTFKVSLKQLFKNAFLLTFGTAVRSICYIIGMLAFAVVSVVIFAYVPMLAISLFLILLIAMFNLAGHICSYPVIKKYMIDNTNKNEEGNED